MAQFSFHMRLTRKPHISFRTTDIETAMEQERSYCLRISMAMVCASEDTDSVVPFHRARHAMERLAFRAFDIHLDEDPLPRKMQRIYRDMFPIHKIPDEFADDMHIRITCVCKGLLQSRNPIIIVVK